MQNRRREARLRRPSCVSCGSPKPGIRKSAAGQRFLERRKVSRIDTRLASFTRAGRARSWRLSKVREPRERSTHHESRDRDVRGSVHSSCAGNKNAHQHERVARRSESLCRENRRYPQVARKCASTTRRNREPTRHECSYEEREKAESRSDASRVATLGRPQGPSGRIAALVW
jgi:hypothetical protein